MLSENEVDGMLESVWEERFGDTRRAVKLGESVEVDGLLGIVEMDLD